MPLVSSEKGKLVCTSANRHFWDVLPLTDMCANLFRCSHNLPLTDLHRIDLPFEPSGHSFNLNLSTTNFR